MHDPYEAFRHRGFRLYASSYVLTVIGSQILTATVQWDVYQQSKDPFAIGLVGLINAVPILLLALPAGHVADSFNRKHVLLLTQSLLTMVPLTLAVLQVVYCNRIPHVLMYSLLAANAVALTFARPARSAIMPGLLPRSAYPNAFAWMSSVFETAGWIGPALGGALIAFGIVWSYCLSGLCLLACTLIMCFLPKPITISEESQELGWQGLSKGVRFVFSTPLMLAAMTLDLFAVLLGGVVYLLPVFADRLEVGPIGYGWMRAAPAVGACVMAVMQAHRPPHGRAGPVMLRAVAVFGLATICFGWSQNFWLSLVMLALIGASDNVSVVIRQIIVQSLTPDAMRGRVAAVNQMFIGASNELGGLESGVTAKLFGPAWSVVGGGIGTLLVVISVACRWPQIRRLKSLRDLSPAIEPAPVSDSSSA
jgi:MFS family permease